MAAKLKILKIANSHEIVNCDLCLRRPAVYEVRFDGTRLCELCLTKYLNEHGIKRYQVRIV